jgi:hypothetical protein
MPFYPPKGLDEIIKTLNAEIVKIESRTLKGLIRAQIKIRRDMDMVSPKIPVDTGNLRSSYFTVTSDGDTPDGAAANFINKDGRAGVLSANHTAIINESLDNAKKKGYPYIIFGFTAFYSIYVHEMVGANFKRQGAGAKFLEAALKNNKDAILKIIGQEATIK